MGIKEKPESGDDLLKHVTRQREKFLFQYREPVEMVIARKRYQAAERIVELTVKREKDVGITLTDRIDQVVCHRFAGPVIFAVILYLFYEATMVGGQKLANLWFPYLGMLRDLIASLLPQAGLIHEGLLRSFTLGVTDGAVAVMNYLPIFLVLFTLIAILEDTGYMARIAFIMDRILRNFGLHGQSTLPMMLGGVYIGGCAIPGVMACRAMKDERARLTTIMIVPLMNCMAKVPFYVLMTGIFFKEHRGSVLFFMSIITLIVAFIVAKVLNLTVLRGKESAPFVLEMPAYHVPTIQGVLRRCVERTWLFVKKVITIVIAIAILVWVFITLPGLGKEREAYYDTRANETIQTFMKKIGRDNPYAGLLEGEGLTGFSHYWARYRKGTMGAGKEAKETLDQKFREENSEFFKIVKKGKYEVEGKKTKDKDAAKVYKTYKKMDKKLAGLRRERKKERIRVSYLGRFGKFLEPVSMWAGFNWKVNIALVSSFAAKENMVATLGTIYSMETEQTGVKREALAETMEKTEADWTPLHALVIMLFIALFPPCIATLIMVKVETNSTGWMLFAAIYPIILGFLLAVGVFQGGQFLGFGALGTMVSLLVLSLVIMTAVGLMGRKPEEV